MKLSVLLLVLALAILTVDGVLELLGGDYWGGGRTLLVVGLLPLALRTQRKP